MILGSLFLFAPRLVFAFSPGFLSRLATYPGGSAAEVEWYQPKERVLGEENSQLERDPEQTKKLQSALDEMTAYAETRSSLSLLVLHRGKIILEEYFRHHSKDALSNAYSMTKTLTSLLIGELVAEGKIRPDDLFSKHVPWGSRWPGVTLTHLLQMRAGLENPNDENSLSALVLMHAGADIPGVLKTLRLDVPPGSAYVYSNFNTQALALVIEKVSNLRFGEFLSQRIWGPLGAGDAYLWLDRPGGTSHAYCCFFTNTRSWARVGQMLLDRGQWRGREIVSPSWIDWIRTPSPTEPDYGGHLWLARSDQGTRADDRSEPFIAKDMFYLDGRDKQRVYVIPSRELVVVRLGTNSSGWDDAYLPNTAVRAVDALRAAGPP